ncbi:NUDIX domain-containing protein [Paenibacillus sp. GYB006]|uniref:NUDIX domain-containing protein n=1 Tax=Paenibacillus sp. GYB006 TaxID=2994394 RepID=UPI002F967037
MKHDKLVKKKSVGFILQSDQIGRKKLLVYSNVPGVLFRLPGGNIDPNETIEEALYREILEESGLTNLILVRELGVQQYYKVFIDSIVERHDFLLMTNGDLPHKWEFIGSGDGEDQETLFKYQWINNDQIHLIDEEYRRDITKTYIREFFS